MHIAHCFFFPFSFLSFELHLFVFWNQKLLTSDKMKKLLFVLLLISLRWIPCKHFVAVICFVFLPFLFSFSTFFYWSCDQPSTIVLNFVLFWSNSNDMAWGWWCFSAFIAEHITRNGSKTATRNICFPLQTFPFILLCIYFLNALLPGIFSYLFRFLFGFPVPQTLLFHWAYNFRFQLHFSIILLLRKFPLHQFQMQWNFLNFSFYLTFSRLRLQKRNLAK